VVEQGRKEGEVVEQGREEDEVVEQGREEGEVVNQEKKLDDVRSVLKCLQTMAGQLSETHKQFLLSDLEMLTAGLKAMDARDLEEKEEVEVTDARVLVVFYFVCILLHNLIYQNYSHVR
jgi:hypothetical protein